jgi:hypothetical protein
MASKTGQSQLSFFDSFRAKSVIWALASLEKGGQILTYHFLLTPAFATTLPTVGVSYLKEQLMWMLFMLENIIEIIRSLIRFLFIR